MRGFLGRSDKVGHYRLFSDPALKRWVDIPENAIRHRRRIPGDEDGYGERSVVWVHNDVALVQGEVTTAGAEADFLLGPWSSDLPEPPSDEEIQAALRVVNFAAAAAKVRRSPYRTRARSLRDCCKA